MKKWLFVAGTALVLVGTPVVGWFAGLEIGESVCDHDGEFLACLSETIFGGLIGFAAGSVVSLVLAVGLFLRRRRRRRVALT